MNKPSWTQVLYVSFPLSMQTARPVGRVSRHAKRLIDLSLALVLVFILAPLMLVLAALVRGSDGGPALFRQERIGRGGRLFRCWKFRTMSCNAEQMLLDYISGNPEAEREWRENQKLVDDPRVTRLGNFLRKSSLDELPQLYNILMGQMSFVGPRPIVAAEVERYGEAFQHCFSVPPGLTGLWQTSGRNDCSYAQRIVLDSRYASEWDLLLDAEIMLKTVPAVLLQKGSR